MSRPRDIICFGGQDWWYHNRAHSDFQLMVCASRRARVLLVNSLGMRMPMPGKSTMPARRILRKLKSMMRYTRRPFADRDLTVMTPLFLPLYGEGTGARRNARFIRWQVERVARRLGMAEPDIVVTVPTAWPVARDMKRASLVYNRSDRHSAFAEADGDVIGGIERDLLRNADRVLYSSRAFLESERALTGDRACFLDHGVDVRHFAASTPKGGLRDVPVPRPLIGFFGSLDDFVIDFGLIERLAAERPQYGVVLIGDSTVALDRITRHPNVRHLGFRPYEEIPRLAADFDVAIMPWLDNDWIKSCNPIKLKEYLSLGLEVVTTWFPEVEHYRDFVHVARDPDGFLAQIDAVVAGRRSPGDRASLLGRATWDDRTDELFGILDAAAAR